MLDHSLPHDIILRRLRLGEVFRNHERVVPYVLDGFRIVHGHNLDLIEVFVALIADINRAVLVNVEILASRTIGPFSPMTL